MKISRDEFIKQAFINNLNAKSNRPVSILNNKSQRFLIAKTKFLAQYLELKGLIKSDYRKSVINYCANCVNYNEEASDKFLIKFQNILKEA